MINEQAAIETAQNDHTDDMPVEAVDHQLCISQVCILLADIDWNDM